MTDVRSLLRNERAARRIDHPNASYSATGKLSCTVCSISLPSDQDSFNKHLKSTQHAMRAERLRLSQKPPSKPQSATTQLIQGSPPPNTKKRKAADSEADDTRKRNKAAESPFEDTVLVEDAVLQTQDAALPPPSPDPVKAPAPLDQPNPQIDEAEWAAFERDIATPPPPDPFSNQSIISAAPVSAAELAEQEKLKAKEEGKERPDQEMEDEKEDAARALEEEFEEMEGLEERLKRLREKREEIRVRAVVEEQVEKGEKEEVSLNAEVEGESSEDEELDEWGLMR